MLTLGTRHTYTTPINAAMSDLRVYATALSEESIKELYNTKASIYLTKCLMFMMKKENIENITKKQLMEKKKLFFKR